MERTRYFCSIIVTMFVFYLSLLPFVSISFSWVDGVREDDWPSEDMKAIEVAETDLDRLFTND